MKKGLLEGNACVERISFVSWTDGHAKKKSKDKRKISFDSFRDCDGGKKRPQKIIAETTAHQMQKDFLWTKLGKQVTDKLLQTTNGQLSICDSSALFFGN